MRDFGRVFINLQKFQLHQESIFMSNIEIWQQQLKEVARPEKVKILSSFFKTGKGGYGEGDTFIGIVVPDNRRISKAFFNLPFQEIAEMLSSPIHEFRFAALIALVERYHRFRKDAAARAEIANFYLSHTSSINNWDLVDLSSPQIIGSQMLYTGSTDVATRLAQSSNLWEQRISIVSSFTLIKAGEFALTLRLAEKFLSHKHDLIHKASGWMLREVGKRSQDTLCEFLDKHAAEMPRTMLRYAIEKFNTQLRKHYMSK